jgi:hypothetical protein
LAFHGTPLLLEDAPGKVQLGTGRRRIHMRYA